MGFSTRCLLNLGLIIVLVSCTKPQQNSTPQVFYKGLYARPVNFDLSQLTDGATMSVVNQIYEGLLEFDSFLNVVPVLAEYFKVSEDGKLYSFYLRKHLKFQNGKELTSVDCIKSFERLLSKSSRVYNYYNIIKGADEFHSGKKNFVSGLKTPDKYTFEIELKNRFPPFLMILAGITAKILPLENMNPENLFEHPIGTGPFEMESFGTTQIVLKRNESYWNTKPKLEKIIFKILDEDKAIDAAIKGELDDLTNYPLNGDEKIFELGKKESIPVVATWVIALNTKLSPFNILSNRISFKNAISSKEFTDKFYPGQTVANSFIPPGLPGFLYEIPSNKFAPKPFKDKVTLYIPDLLSKASEIKNYFETTFRSKGFNVVGKLISWDQFMEYFNQRKMQASLFSTQADYPDTEFLVRSFETNNPDNFTSLSSQVVDSLIADAREVSSRDKRAEIYRKLNLEINNEAPTINLFHYRSNYWFSSCVKGVQLNSLGESYIPYKNVYLEGGNCHTNHQGSLSE